MSKYAFAVEVLVIVSAACLADAAIQTPQEKVRRRIQDLRFGSYATSRQVEQLACDQGFRADAWNAVQRMGITKLYLEVYRSGHVVTREKLVLARDWLEERGIDVVGGIATVPGGDIGIRQKGPLGWFNWQNEKTQRDLEPIVRLAASVFDAFIVDDFLCTGDVSSESDRARGNRSWGEYRRALLTTLARSIFVDPAREVNPTITMIVKYPQWYDRFHRFGYDTQTLPRIFDRVWVGTETRGRNTQRFGFVQPYEGFINYRWLAGIAGDRIGGAWFDHGDCAEHDFLDQAYMSVLAGASELVFFNLGNVVEGHADHEKVVAQFDRLADLAACVRAYPVAGVPAYKPPNSEPYGDMYLMDFLGMLGAPLVPVHEFPETAQVIFLPAQAAADPHLLAHVHRALADGAHVIVTTNLLLAISQGDELAGLLSLEANLASRPFRAALISPGPDPRESKGNDVMIDLEAPIEATRPGDIGCMAEGKTFLLLRTVPTSAGRLSLLNTHTYSQADFDAVGEVLLCPRPLGLLSMHGPALSAIRAVFNGLPAGETALMGGELPGLIAKGPSGVTFHPLGAFGQAGFVVQNFNDERVSVTVTIPMQTQGPRRFTDRLSARPVGFTATAAGTERIFRIPLAPRERAWVQAAGRDTSPP